LDRREVAERVIRAILEEAEVGDKEAERLGRVLARVLWELFGGSESVESEGGSSVGERLGVSGIAELDEVAEVIVDRVGFTSGSGKVELSDLAERVLSVLKDKGGWVSIPELASELGVDLVEVHNAVNELLRAGKVEVDERGVNVMIRGD